MKHNEIAQKVEELLETPELIEVIETHQFKKFLDKIPIAILVSSIRNSERVVYTNLEFEKLTGQSRASIQGKPWDALKGQGEDDDRQLSKAIIDTNDYVGAFRIERPPCEPAIVDVYSTIIEADDGVPVYRLVALLDVGAYVLVEREKFKQSIREKDLLLLELQHRVKNNLQMIAALIRLEARNLPTEATAAALSGIAGRIEALRILYEFLSPQDKNQEVDLGTYLSQIASSVMRTHALEGIRLNLKVDVYPVSINIAMPCGLLINELLTNALKHAFVDRDSGTITLSCIAEEKGCRVVVADDGLGLPSNSEWPKDGNLGALIVQSLRENAHAGLAVQSNPGAGTRIEITFSRRD